MKPWFNYDLNLVSNVKDLARFVSIALKNMVDLLNNNVTYSDNVRCSIVKGVIFTSGVELGVEHTLGIVPIGYQVISRDASAVIYNGTSQWNGSRIYLIASANVIADIIVLGG